MLNKKKKDFTEKEFLKNNRIFKLIYLITIILFCIGLLILLSIII